MTEKVITYSFCDSFLDRLADFIDEHYIRNGRDIRRLAIVFGGRRPALFLKRALAEKFKKVFVPPRFFTIDEFIQYTVRQEELFTPAQDLDQCYLLFRLAQKATPAILRGRESFAQFLPWAREILAFIDQIDIEQVSDERLKTMEAVARIGYPVPPDINELLMQMVTLRQAYHAQMRETHQYARGYQYRRAAELIGQVDFVEFEQIGFANFFYFNRAEETVVKNLYRRGKAMFFFQGDERRWPILKRVAGQLGCSITEGKEPETPHFSLKLCAGFDVHSQVSLVREIIKDFPDKHQTVIVVPEVAHLIPLLSELAGQVQDFNVSMGYPLKRSSLAGFLELVFAAQLSRRGGAYYARDYLRLLRHPLVKNLQGPGGSTATRILVHKIEEILTGEIRTDLSGSLFVNLEDLLRLPELYEEARKTLQGMGSECPPSSLEQVLKEIHESFFSRWEGIGHFQEFAAVLENVMNVLIARSFLSAYPLNLKIADRLQDIIDEMKVLPFRAEVFPCRDIFKIFTAQLEREMVSFAGSPLKGLQILGLFETRSLNFDHVIVLDVNEGTLPRLNIYDPLIPREVMLSLGLDRLEQEEEMQRYQFMRLISSAKTVHLVYQESPDKERSRFIEELVWDAEKKTQSLAGVPVIRAGFTVDVARKERSIAKTPAMVALLKKHRYSASSISTYLRNPLEFYERYVLGLEEKEDLLDEPENRQVGTFVHELLEETFKNFLGRKPLIDQSFRRYFQSRFEERFAATFAKVMQADAFLLKKVLDVRLNRFLDNEADNPERQVKEIIFIEKSFEDVIPLSCGDIRFVYKVDRIDRMEDGTVLILDYKTGSVDPMPKGIERIESMDLSRTAIRNTVHSFQIPLYFHYLETYFKDETVNAAFYNLRTLEVAKFVDRKMSFDRPRINQAFRRALDFILTEIIDPAIPFVEDKGE